MASPSSNSEEEEVLLLLQKCTEEVTLELKHDSFSGDSSGEGGISNLQSRLEALKKCSSSAASACASTLSSVVPTAQATGDSGVGVALTLEERLLRLKMKNDDHNAHDGNNILDDDNGKGNTKWKTAQRIRAVLAFLNVKYSSGTKNPTSRSYQSTRRSSS